MTKTWPILVVDDHESTRALLRRILQSAGFDKVNEASTGAEALRMLRLSPVRAIICDDRMDEMDGLELYEQLRHSDTLSDIPFILMSSDDDLRLLRAAARCGVDLLIKPFPPETLLNSVARALGTPQMASA